VDYISTGSMLNTPLYAEIAMYKPQRKGFAVAWLNHKEKFIQVVPPPVLDKT